MSSSQRKQPTKRKFEEDNKDSTSSPSPQSPKRPRTDLAPLNIAEATMEDKVIELYESLLEAQIKYPEKKGRFVRIGELYKEYLMSKSNKQQKADLFLSSVKSLKNTDVTCYNAHFKTTLVDEICTAIKSKNEELEKLSDNLVGILENREQAAQAKAPADPLARVHLMAGVEAHQKQALFPINTGDSKKWVDPEESIRYYEIIAIYELYIHWSQLLVQNKFEAALPYIEQAYKRLGNLPPKTSKEIDDFRQYQHDFASTLNGLGNSYSSNNLNQGLSYFEKARKIAGDFSSIDEKYKPLALQIQHNIAVTLFNLGYEFYDKSEFEKSLEHFEQAYTSQNDFLLKKQDASTYEEKKELDNCLDYKARALDAMGSKLCEQKQYQKAAEYFRKAINEAKKISVINPEMIAHYQRNLTLTLRDLALDYKTSGDLYFREQKSKEAFQCFELAHKIQQELPLDNNEDKSDLEKYQCYMANAAYQAGVILHNQHQDLEAVEYFKQAYEIQKNPSPIINIQFMENLDPYQANIVNSLCLVGDKYIKENNPEKGLFYYEQAYQHQETTLPATDFSKRIFATCQLVYASNLHVKGLDLEKKGDHQAALVHYEKAHQIVSNSIADNEKKRDELSRFKKSIARSFSKMGNLCDQKEQHEAAFQLHEKAWFKQKELNEQNIEVEIYQQRTANSLYKIGLAYIKENKPEKGVDIIKKAYDLQTNPLPIRIKVDSDLALYKTDIASGLFQIAKQHIEEKKEEAALPYLHKAITELRNTPFLTDTGRENLSLYSVKLAQTRRHIGLKLTEEKNYNEALTNFRIASKILQSIPEERKLYNANRQDIASALFFLGDMYLSNNENATALVYFETAHDDCKALQTIFPEDKIKLEMAQHYKAKALHAIATELFRESKFNEALTYWEKAYDTQKNPPSTQLDVTEHIDLYQSKIEDLREHLGLPPLQNVSQTVVSLFYTPHLSAEQSPTATQKEELLIKVSNRTPHD